MLKTEVFVQNLQEGVDNGLCEMCLQFRYLGKTLTDLLTNRSTDQQTNKHTHKQTNLTFPQLVTQFRALYVKQGFPTAIKSVHAPQHVWQILLILSSHLHVGFQVWFSLRSPNQNHVYVLPVSYTCHMPCPSHSPCL